MVRFGAEAALKQPPVTVQKPLRQHQRLHNRNRRSANINQLAHHYHNHHHPYASIQNLAPVIPATSTLSSLQNPLPPAYHPSVSLSFNYNAVNSTENTNTNNNNININNATTTVSEQHLFLKPTRCVSTTTPKKRPAAASSTTTPVATTTAHCKAKDSLVLPSPIPHMPPLHAQQQQPIEKRSSIITDSDYRTQSSATTTTASSSSSSASSSSRSSSENETLSKNKGAEHVSACEALLHVEEKFIALMQKGVQHYSRPLRHYLIQPKQHQALFQNIEKLLAINEYQFNQMISQEDSILFDMFSTIGKLYENKTRMSSEAFDIYLAGIERSLHLMESFGTETNNNNNINSFLSESEHELNMSLRTFLLLPLFYVNCVHACLGKIMKHTSVQSDDFVCLSNLCANLSNYVTRSNHVLQRHVLGGRVENNPLMSGKIDEEEEQEHKEQEADNHEFTTNNYNNKDQTNCSSEYQESDEIEYDEVKPIYVISPISLIYSSFVEYKQVKANRWRQVRLLFFADRVVLLSAHANVDKFLALLMQNVNSSAMSTRFSYKTILFADVLKSKFNSSSSSSSSQCEFYLKYSKPTCVNGRSNTIQLKCATREEKSQWHRLFSRYFVN